MDMIDFARALSASAENHSKYGGHIKCHPKYDVMCLNTSSVEVDDFFIMKNIVSYENISIIDSMIALKSENAEDFINNLCFSAHCRYLQLFTDGENYEFILRFLSDINKCSLNTIEINYNYTELYKLFEIIENQSINFNPYSLIKLNKIVLLNSKSKVIGHSHDPKYFDCSYSDTFNNHPILHSETENLYEIVVNSSYELYIENRVFEIVCNNPTRLFSTHIVGLNEESIDVLNDALIEFNPKLVAFKNKNINENCLNSIAKTKLKNISYISLQINDKIFHYVGEEYSNLLSFIYKLNQNCKSALKIECEIEEKSNEHLNHLDFLKCKVFNLQVVNSLSKCCWRSLKKVDIESSLNPSVIYCLLKSNLFIDSLKLVFKKWFENQRDKEFIKFIKTLQNVENVEIKLPVSEEQRNSNRIIIFY